MQYGFLYAVKAANDFPLPLLIINLFKPTADNIVRPQIEFSQFLEIFFCHNCAPNPQGAADSGRGISGGRPVGGGGQLFVCLLLRPRAGIPGISPNPLF